MMRSLTISTLAIVFLFHSDLSRAQWVDPNGPFGTTLTSFAVSGLNLFAGTTVGGVYLSNDSGTSWRPINAGLTTNYVTALATNGSNVFAGTYSNGVFASTNYGASWSPASTGLPPSKAIQVLAFSGTNLFAGTGGGGVYLSTDNGNSWNSASAGITDVSVTAITASGTYLFAGTANGLVFFSSDNGTFWTSASTGLPPSSVTSLAVLGTNNPPTNLMVGMFNAIYTTTNMGTSWTLSTTGLPTSIEGASFAIIGSNIFAGMYDGVFLSSNGGTSWNVVDTGLPANPNITAMAAIGTTVIAGTSTLGVFRSTNNGANWTSPNTGLPVNSINVLYANGTDLYAGTLGVYRSTDNGSDWTPASNGLPTGNMDVTALISVGTYLFAGTQSDGSGIYGDNVFLSTDSGASWNPASSGITPNSNVTAFAVFGHNLFAATLGHGVFLSQDNGNSWTGVNNGLPADAAVNILSVPINTLAVIGTRIFAGTTSESNGNQNVGGGVYMSTDSGGSWTDVSSGLPTQPGPDDVNALAVIGTTLFAGTSASQPQESTGPVFISTNNGTSWTSASSGFPTNAFDASLLADGKTLYAGATLGGILTSTDNGTSWTDAGTPPLAGKVLAVNPAYLFTAYQSVWRLFLVNLALRIQAARDTQGVSLKSTGTVSVTLSDDTAGAVAHRIDFVNNSSSTLVVDSAMLTNRLNQFSISQLFPGVPDTVYPNDTFSMIVIFGGDDTGGIYRDTLVLSVGDPTLFYAYLTGKSFSSQSGVFQNLPTASAFLRIYPNPFTQQSTIQFSSSEEGYADVTIVNLLGGQVARIFSGELNAGEHEYSWDASGLPPGMYECVVRTNGSVEQTPLLLLR